MNNKQQKAWKYVQRAASRDTDFPVLNGVNSADAHIEATDGFRLHAARQPVEKRGVLDRDSLEPVEGAFPDVGRVVARQGKPVVTITLDAQYLHQATMGMTGTVTLRVHGPAKPLEVLGVLGKEEIEAYALIMPMFVNPDKREVEHSWRPWEGDAKEP